MKVKTNSLTFSFTLETSFQLLRDSYYDLFIKIFNLLLLLCYKRRSGENTQTYRGSLRPPSIAEIVRMRTL